MYNVSKGDTMKVIRTFDDLKKIKFEKIKESVFWNSSNDDEIKLHKVHIYPAKFPSIVARKAFEYAEKNNKKINFVGDIFCGCGTVAVETKIRGYDFWGCDINPVAVLLSKVKTYEYDLEKFDDYFNQIISRFYLEPIVDNYEMANERLRYWYSREQYNELYSIKKNILEIEMDKKYTQLFLCIFSSILKISSKWLSNSVKPQIDPKKISVSSIENFKKKSMYFKEAIIESDFPKNKSTIDIIEDNVLKINTKNKLDLIITSPPYVTSYEYADLHQLSLLWLDFTNDYKELREGSIGSKYNLKKAEKYYLNKTANKIIKSLPNNHKLKSIERYYHEMNLVVKKMYDILRKNGIGILVIGDTEFNGVRIENAKCISEMIIEAGFSIRDISKRKISNKFLPSHRDKNGRFSSNLNDRKIYSEEYIIVFEKV